MKQSISALVVYQGSGPLSILHRYLESLSIRTVHVQSCGEVWQALTGTNPPHLVFTDTTLADGTWADVTAIAAKAARAVEVIVVSRLVDTRLYIEAIEAGAFDFIVPPFGTEDLSYVVRCAADNVRERREVQARAEQHPQRLLFPSLTQTSLAAMQRPKSNAA
jgi:DNA-binding NtrC family response regulator